MMSYLRAPSRAISLVLGLLAMALLASCGGGGGVGDGNTLARLSIVQLDGTQPTGSLAVPRCIPTLLRAIGTFDDGSQEDMTLRVNWSSTGTVPVSNGQGTFLKGVVTPSGTPGSMDTIRIDFVGLSAQQNVSIQEARLELSAAQSQLAVGNLTLPLFLTGVLGAPGSQTRISVNDRVEWQSSNSALVTVSSLGVLTPLSTSPDGLTQDIVITADTGIPACSPQPSFTLKLHNKALTQLNLSPKGPVTMAPLTSQRFTATGVYGDFVQDVTGLVRYSSLDATDPSKVSSSAVFQGNLLSTASKGQATLKAVLDQFGEIGDGPNDIASNTVALTVTDATLKDFIISPTNPKMLVGTSLAMTSTGTFSDNSTQDISLNMLWTSSDTTIANFNTLFGFGNILNALQATATPLTVTATRSTGCDVDPGSSTCVRTTGLTTDGALASLRIEDSKGSACTTAAPCFVALGGASSLRAMGTLNGGGTQDLTEFVIWSVSNPTTTIATISNASGISGRALGRSDGTVSISAQYSSISASGSLRVEADTDGDGVPDSKDQCANTPVGTQVNVNGCPDSDGDGVKDMDDQCPNTQPGKAVNAAGCPDSDGDGFFDNEDVCPMEDSRVTPPGPSNSSSRRGCQCDNPTGLASPLPTCVDP